MGKNVDLENAANENEALGLCTRVVLKLLRGLEGDHPKLYVDNFYTSPTLSWKLYKKGVGACGTCRTIRK